MLKDKLLPISIFCLAISIVIGAYLISKGMQFSGRFISEGVSQGLNNFNNTINNKIVNNVEEKNNINLSDAAKYLGISEDMLIKVVYNKDSKIPYIKIDGYLIFNKNALDKWISESGFEM